ncbi:probable short-chain dehydrogenase, partial [Bordetella bronchiseptica MO211]
SPCCPTGQPWAPRIRGSGAGRCPIPAHRGRSAWSGCARPCAPRSPRRSTPTSAPRPARLDGRCPDDLPAVPARGDDRPALAGENVPRTEPTPANLANGARS